MQILSIPLSALNVREFPKFSRLLENRGRETWWWRQILDRKWKYTAVSRMRNEKYAILYLYLWPNCRNVRVSKEIGVEEHDDDVRF